SWMGRKITPLPVPATARGRGAVIPFGDDSYLLVWDGRVYRGHGKRLEAFAGDALVPADPVSTTITMMDGSIVGVFGGGLLRVTPRRDAHPDHGLRRPSRARPRRR